MLDEEDAAPDAGVGGAEFGDLGRLAAVEGQMQAMMARLDDLAEVRRAELIERQQAPEPPWVAALEHVWRGLGDLRVEVATAAEAAQARVAAVEERVSGSVAVLSDEFQTQQGDLGAVIGSLGETRSDVQRIAEAHHELARVQADLDQLAPQVAAVVADLSPITAAVGELEQSRVGHEGRLDGLAQQLAEAEVKRSALKGSTDAVATHVHMLEELIEKSVRHAVAGIVAAQGELSAKIEGRARDGRRAEATLAALQVAVDAGASGLHVLEQHLNESRRQLAQMAEARSRPSRAAGIAPTRPAGEDLLDALEQQLQKAERRLTHLVSGENSD